MSWAQAASMMRYSSSEKKAGTARQPTMTVVSAFRSPRPPRPAQERYGQVTVHTYPTLAGMAVAAAHDLGAAPPTALAPRGPANPKFAPRHPPVALPHAPGGGPPLARGPGPGFQHAEYV